MRLTIVIFELKFVRGTFSGSTQLLIGLRPRSPVKRRGPYRSLTSLSTSIVRVSLRSRSLGNKPIVRGGRGEFNQRWSPTKPFDRPSDFFLLLLFCMAADGHKMDAVHHVTRKESLPVGTNESIAG